MLPWRIHTPFCSSVVYIWKTNEIWIAGNREPWRKEQPYCDLESSSGLAESRVQTCLPWTITVCKVAEGMIPGSWTPHQRWHPRSRDSPKQVLGHLFPVSKIKTTKCTVVLVLWLLTISVKKPLAAAVSATECSQLRGKKGKTLMEALRNSSSCVVPWRASLWHMWSWQML